MENCTLSESTNSWSQIDRKWSSLKGNSWKIYLLFLFFGLLSSPGIFAQNFPTQCVSQDLIVVDAELIFEDPCLNCQEGDILYPTLQLAIDNKTGSFRPTFAFWGTLIISDAEGIEIGRQAITGCNNTTGLPANTITPIPFQQIEYVCGNGMKLIDLHLAWTDASQGSKNDCPLDPATINPKCGTLTEIEVRPPLFVNVLDSSNVVCKGDDNGTIELYVNGGDQPYYFDWADLPGTNDVQDRNGLAPGFYTVTVTDANGCFRNIEDIEITEPLEEVSVTASGVDITCFEENDGYLSFSGSGYERLELWRNGVIVLGATLSGDSYVGLEPGTYVLKAFADGGNGEEDACTDESDPIVIDEPEELEIILEADPILCYGDKTSINLSIKGGTLPYAVDWADVSGDDDPEDRTEVPKGEYSVTVTDFNGCIVTGSVDITEPTELVAEVISTTPVPCSGAAEGAVDISVSGGTEPYTFLWSNNSSSEDLLNVSSGTYSVSVTDDNGCNVTLTNINVVELISPIVDAGEGKELTCSETSVQLNGSGSSNDPEANLIFAWSGPGNFSSSLEEPSVSMPGTYTLRVTDDNNSCYTEDTVEVGQDITAPVADAGIDAEITCIAGSVTLSGSGTSDNVDANLEYLWSGPGEFESLDAEIEVSVAGIYTLRVTDLDNGCFDEDEVEVDQNTDRPSADAGANVELTCTMVEVTLTGVPSSDNPSADLEYSWTGPGEFTSSSLEITVDVPGDYTFRVTDKDNGCFAEDSVEVGQDIEKPTADAGSNVELTCSAEEITLTGIGGSANENADIEYAWTGPGGFTSSSLEITVDVPGDYTLRVTDNENGCYTEDTVEVGQDITAPVADAGIDAEITCAAGSVTLSGSGTSDNVDANLEYLWSGPGEFESSDAEIEVSVAGIYILRVTDLDNGCFDEDEVEVDQNTDRPLADAGANVELTCTTVKVTLTGVPSSDNPSADLEYSWTGPGEFTSSSLEITVDVPGDYTFRVTDRDNGCFAEDSVEVGQDIEKPTADAGSNVELTCSVEEITLTGIGGSPNENADLEYAWTGPGGFTSSSLEITVDVPGDYTLRVTDNNNGCYTEDTVEVGQDITAPVADAGIDAEITCAAGSVTLSGSGTSDNVDANLEYLWSGPGEFESSDAEIEVSVAGIYTLRVTDLDNGCFDEDEVEVDQNTDRPSADAGANVELTCTTVEVTLTGVPSSDNPSADLEYSWTGPGEFTSSSLEITVDVPGDYTFRVTDKDNGCFAEDSVEVGQDIEKPTADAGSNVELTCSVEEITLTGIGGSANENADLEYAWTGPGGFTSSTLEITVDVPGDYTLRVTDNDNGCYTEDTVEVGQDITAPVADAGIDAEITCTAGSVTLSGSGTSDNVDANLEYLWSGPGEFESSDAEIEVSVAGIYTLRVTDLDNGCFDEDEVEVSEDVEFPGIDIEVVNESCPGAGDGSITITVSGGTPPYTIEGELLEGNIYVLSDLSAGNYSFVIMGANGCGMAVDEVEVGVSPRPDAPSIIMPPLECFAELGSIAVTSDTEGLQFRIDDGEWFTYLGPIDVAPGNHMLFARDAETLCESAPLDFTISPLPDSPVTPTLEAVQPTCDVLTGTIIVTSRTDLQFFVISIEDLPFVDPLFVDYPSGGFSGLAPGEYAVFAMSADGCESGMATISLLEATDCEQFEGCTLGYWKNHTDRWCSEYLTCTIYGEIFPNAPSQLADLTLLEVLNLGGGGINNLGRQSVAALLNACGDGVDYELGTTGEVIAYVTANFDNAGNAGSYLDMLNNAGCTMGGSKATTAASEDCDADVDAGNGNNGNGKGRNNNAKTPFAVNVFPVPFKETLNLKYEMDYFSDVVIEIYDMRGKHLRTYKEKNVGKGTLTNLRVDFALQANQMYVLKIITERETLVKQIVSSKK
ncbi:hypothetical protein [Salinimicrobium oceani]|uniref:Por secretion system C-terminal sorting domain-containing protein n=1 Tax=Salinimicrobium oceani TaxID=2722702 RepID=A0ABX1D3W8_9FLAO|nr:hypothetical protein [Salinimicrobium oceani]NJW53893.1 hypothetical protein [Salinimicrobium oceani]